MTDWPAEAELFRANLIDEIVAQIGPGPVTLDRLRAAVLAAFPEAYMTTVRDCMEVTVDRPTGTVSVRLPPWFIAPQAA